MNKFDNIEVSVVIPTLGGNILNDTITQLNSGSIKPFEILICIPEKFVTNLTIDIFDNVKVLSTNFMGQVAQRAYGFKNAKSEYVLQLDDDIILDSNCLKNLIDNLITSNKSEAVSPILLFKNSLKDVYKPKNSKLIERFYYYLINGFDGFVPGIITKAGTEIGVNQIYITDKSYKVCWLPGGCILHFKKNLVEYNYFPFKGKAYCEDLFHSKIIENLGISMYITKNAFAYIDDPRIFSVNNKNWFINLIKDYKIRKRFVTLYNLSTSRLHYFYLINIFNYLFKKIYK
jgi:hypothetical protein